MTVSIVPHLDFFKPCQWILLRVIITIYVINLLQDHSIRHGCYFSIASDSAPPDRNTGKPNHRPLEFFFHNDLGISFLNHLQQLTYGIDYKKWHRTANVYSHQQNLTTIKFCWPQIPQFIKKCPGKYLCMIQIFQQTVLLHQSKKRKKKSFIHFLYAMDNFKIKKLYCYNIFLHTYFSPIFDISSVAQL